MSFGQLSRLHPECCISSTSLLPDPSSGFTRQAAVCFAWGFSGCQARPSEQLSSSTTVLRPTLEAEIKLLYSASQPRPRPTNNICFIAVIPATCSLLSPSALPERMCCPLRQVPWKIDSLLSQEQMQPALDKWLEVLSQGTLSRYRGPS